MSKWKYIAPITLAAAAAGVAAALIGRRKTGESARAGATGGVKKDAAPTETLMKKGEYSFVSGFKDAVTVTVGLEYDALRFGFDVIGEDFLTYSSDSHVAVVTGEDFCMQLEYAAFYKGEDLGFLRAAAEKKYPSCADVDFGAAKGFRYTEGDSVCFCLGVDEYSYLLLTVLKTQGSDLSLAEIADCADLRAMLGSISISVGA